MKLKAFSRKDYESKQKVLAGTNSVNCICTISSSCRNRESSNEHKCHWCLVAAIPLCTFPLLLIQKKSFKIFFFSKVKPSQSLLKMWQKLRIWGETDEKRALQSSSWAKPATERIILDFLQGNIEAGNVTAGQCCTRGWNKFAIPALSCTTTHAAKCCHFHAHLSPFLWCNMSGKLSSACPHSQTLCPTFGDTNDRSTEKIPSLHSRAVPGF